MISEKDQALRFRLGNDYIVMDLRLFLKCKQKILFLLKYQKHVGSDKTSAVYPNRRTE